MRSYGDIVTLGDNAHAIAASGYSDIVVLATGSIGTFGASSAGIYAYGSGNVTVNATSNIAAYGSTSLGIFAGGTTSASVTSAGSIVAACRQWHRGDGGRRSFGCEHRQHHNRPMVSASLRAAPAPAP